MSSGPDLRVAVVGAGPVGLTLALLASECLPDASITLFDARDPERDVRADPRTLALSLGSVQLLQRLSCWPGARAEPILSVHVSQQTASAVPGDGRSAEGCAEPLAQASTAFVNIRAEDVGCPMLGAVIAYGALVAHLQARWQACVARQPVRLHSRFGRAVGALLAHDHGVRVDAGQTQDFDLAVVAEGGVFAEQARKALRHDYQQVAWVGTASLEGAPTGQAVERFTPHGPVALLPLPAPPDALPGATLARQAALVWCVPRQDDPVQGLDEGQRLAMLNRLLPQSAGRVGALGPMKRFELGLNAERTLVQGRQVRIGNAAQTLHPVAGQGLNLGLRDAFALVQALRCSPDVDLALRQLERSRAPDRWSMIATTDFLARSFAWQWPGVAAARGLALSTLQGLPSMRRALARQMMFGLR